MFFRLAIFSLLNRKGTIALSLAAMVISLCTLLSVEHIRQQAKENFASSVSGVDLIVGARTGQLNLLLYSVFRVGAPSNNLSWQSYQHIAANKNVAWSIPISLGDSHRGYKVLGTTQAYFQRLRYGNKRSITFEQGRAFNQTREVVLGAEIGRKLRYNLGDKIIVAHGLASTSFSQHEEHPFTVVGILAPTGTPIDQTLHVSLASIKAIHQAPRYQSQNQSASKEQHNNSHSDDENYNESITAVFLGLKSKLSTFRIQRSLNEFQYEPLSAVLPGVVLMELWQSLGVVEKVLRLILILVFVATLLGLCALQLSSLRTRHREIQLLRVMGAPSTFLFGLIVMETLLVTLLASGISCFLLILIIKLTAPIIASQWGIFISANLLSKSNLILLAATSLGSFVVSLMPAYSMVVMGRSAHGSSD